MESKEKSVVFSILQFGSVTGNKAENYKKVEKLLKDNLSSEADFLVLPEVWTCGWSCVDFPACSEFIENSETVEFLSKIAKENNVNILGGSFIQKTGEGKCLNTCPVIDRKGRLIALYSKNHLYSYCGCNEGDYINAGDSPVMVNIEGVNIGLTICYDIRFPEIFRAYRLAGADVLVNMAAWGIKKPIPWETLTRARAIENQCYMFALTQSGQIKDDEWNIGHSYVFDFVGETLAEITNQREGIVLVKIDFKNLYEYRNNCTILKDIRETYEVKCV